MGIERVCGQQFALPTELALANRRQHVGHFSAKDGAGIAGNISSAGSPLCRRCRAFWRNAATYSREAAPSTGTKVISGIIPSAVDMVPGRKPTVLT